jgi:addiction module RelE/StbE family toxin
MIIAFHKRFKKGYAKLRKNEQRQCDERLLLFAQEPYAPPLHNHELQGELAGTHSINITGDYRAHYIKIDTETVLFVDIDTHSNLYGA